MKITKVEAIVCVVSKEGSLPISQSNTSISCLLEVEPSESAYEIRLVDTSEMDKKVSVDDRLEPDATFTDKHENGIDEAIEGYDIAMVSLSAGDTETLDDKRMNNLEMVLNLLQGKLRATKGEIKIEYVYLGVTDECCYDLRKDLLYTNKSMCEKGIDFLMKRVDDVSDIWVQIEQPKRKLPQMLSIKLTDEKNLTQGRLVLVDLLYPTFSLLLSPSNKKEALESSCVHLYDTVRIISSSAPASFTEEIPYFLTKELGPYISGAKKMILSTYFQDRIDDERILAKTKVCFDFIDSLRGTRVVMLKNRLDTDSKDKRKRESERNIQILQIRCKSLKEQLKKEKSSRENLKKQIEIDEKIIEELTTNLKQAREQKEDQEYLLEYIKSSHEEQVQKKDTEFQELFLKNDKERLLIRQIQRTAEVVKQFKEQNQ
ncbi:hypothetical protein INT48_004390 [Thamnidium elegans]|uniref:Uncharacterized protein n=1 Tax=Thamnidium elegans TaxID=101142 RepID=A0A8H7VWF1_9FUNG|nr:hypothetical protein INT48_004390 [Thamnidium elegans]